MPADGKRAHEDEKSGTEDESGRDKNEDENEDENEARLRRETTAKQDRERPRREEARRVEQRRARNTGQRQGERWVESRCAARGQCTDVHCTRCLHYGLPTQEQVAVSRGERVVRRDARVTPRTVTRRATFLTQHLVGRGEGIVIAAALALQDALVEDVQRAATARGRPTYHYVDDTHLRVASNGERGSQPEAE